MNINLKKGKKIYPLGIGGHICAYVHNLNELVKVDLLVEKDSQYFFKDQVLRYWLSYRELGTELSEKPRERVLDELMGDLEERYLRASSESGKAKEYEFRAKLEDKYGLKLRNYISPDGQIEFDLVGRKGRATYIFEIKWRNRSSNYKDLKKFVEKVKSSEFKYYGNTPRDACDKSIGFGSGTVAEWGYNRTD